MRCSQSFEQRGKLTSGDYSGAPVIIYFEDYCTVYLSHEYQPLLTGITNATQHFHRSKSGDRMNKQSSAKQNTLHRDQIQLYKDEIIALNEKNHKLKRGMRALNLINENLEREASALINSHKDLDNQVKNLRKRLSKDEACIIA